MMEAFDASIMDVLLLLVPTHTMRGYEGQGDFFINSLDSDKKGPLIFKGDSTAAPYVYPGIQIIHPRAFDVEDFSMSKKWPIPQLWKKWGERLFGMVVDDGDWFDTGNLIGLKAARSSIVHRN
jgi:MurNAc alpha-1-phosphate uridylyltransferase